MKFEEGLPYITRETVQDPTGLYTDTCFPNTIIGDNKLTTPKIAVDHKQAKVKFKNIVQANIPWVKLLEKYSVRIFPLLPSDLQEDS